MKHDLSEQIRDAGYEALFFLGGFLAVSLHPTPRNLERVFDWIDESQARRQQMGRLAKRGLIETSPEGDRTEWVARLTDRGRAAFAGGRDPEVAWGREWDGKWRLLSFDLPRTAQEVRMKLRRWLKANHVGQLQGSVWITPDPIPALSEILADLPTKPGSIVVFEGAVAGGRDERDLSAGAWDFAAINAGYRRYVTMTADALRALNGKAPSMKLIGKILSEDRRAWWEAVRRDPLLPRVLHPKAYLGGEAWKARGKLLKKLAKPIPAGSGAS